MPIYEYECEKCGLQFEYLVIGKDDDIKCEFCNSKKVKKILSVIGIKSGDKFKSSSSNSSCSICSLNSCDSCK